MIGNDKHFVDSKMLRKCIQMGMLDGTIRMVKQMGTVILKPNIILRNVLYVPEFKHNLLSIRRLTEKEKLKLIFIDQWFLFQDRCDCKFIGGRLKCGGVYKMVQDEKDLKKFLLADGNEIIKRCNNLVNGKRNVEKVTLFHQKLGHTSLCKLKHILECECKGLNELFCDTCCLAKHHKLPFPLSTSIVSDKFNLLHVDLWGLYRLLSLTGAKYFLTLLDDYSRVTWTFLNNSKEQVKDVLWKFLAYTENHFKTSVKTIRSDNRTEVVTPRPLIGRVKCHQ
ncbi:Retrovirus-related Pol polyprotein from transposon RE2 [Bienertia sinuspersici]